VAGSGSGSGPGSGVVDAVAVDVGIVCVVVGPFPFPSSFGGVWVDAVSGCGGESGGVLLYCARILSTSAMKLSAWLSVRGGGRGYMPKMGVLGSGLEWLVTAGGGLE
jgi:hypothetical protein